MRGIDDFNCAEYAAQFGGGGHMGAAGFIMAKEDLDNWRVSQNFKLTNEEAREFLYKSPLEKKYGPVVI